MAELVQKGGKGAGLLGSGGPKAEGAYAWGVTLQGCGLCAWSLVGSLSQPDIAR